jgi:hypothetical protein
MESTVLAAHIRHYSCYYSVHKHQLLSLFQVGVRRLPGAEAADGEQHSGGLRYQEVSLIPRFSLLFLFPLIIYLFIYLFPRA